MNQTTTLEENQTTPLESIVQGTDDLHLAPAVRELLSNAYFLFGEEFPHLSGLRYVTTPDTLKNSNIFYLFLEMPSRSSCQEDIAYNPENSCFYFWMKKEYFGDQKEYTSTELLSHLRGRFQESMEIYERDWKKKEMLRDV